VFSEALAGLDLSGTTHTNAGTTNDGWTFTNANYNDASGTVTDSIAKANATIAVTPYTVTYDGLPHTATGTATGVQGENLAGLDLSGTTHTDAGDYTDAWTFTDATGNYNNAGGTVLDRIAKSSAVTIVVNGYTGVYDALPHGATGSATGVLGENLTSLLSLGAAFTNVPGGTAAWSFAGNNDYSPASGSVNIVITKAPLTVKANNASRLYGSPNPAFSASYSGFQGADTFAGSVTGAPSLTTTATQFSATGTYVITAAAGTLASNNYSFNFVNGTLSIQLSGLVGLNSVSFGAQKGLADSFNSSGGYPATQGNSAVILSNGPIEIGGATINGSLVSTQGSIQLQPGTIVIGNVRAGTTVSNKGTVNGTIAQNQTSAALVAPAVPDCGAFSPNSGLGGDYSYSNGDLKVTGNNTVTLANGSYCFHNVTLTGQARLQVTGPVAISLTGTLSAGGGSFANTTGSPSNLKIASSYAGNGGVSLNGGAEAYLTVYAPTTDVTITGGSSLFGAVLGKTLTANGSPAVHYDTLLPNIWAAFFGF
jgi:hypothetical protein